MSRAASQNCASVFVIYDRGPGSSGLLSDTGYNVRDSHSCGPVVFVANEAIGPSVHRKAYA